MSVEVNFREDGSGGWFGGGEKYRRRRGGGLDSGDRGGDDGRG